MKTMHAVLLAILVILPLSATAADEATLASAHHCMKIQPAGDSADARDEWHRRQTKCLKALYLQIAAPDAATETRAEISLRLDTLEAAYHAARNLCELQNRTRLQKGEQAEWCGTTSLSPFEFRVLLKTMIVNEDAGWVKADPRLQEALE